MNPSFIAKFKTGIRFVVSIFASREFGFVYCLIGTLAQIAHTYFLVTNISSLTGGWKTAQAMAISVFISSSLLFSQQSHRMMIRKIHGVFISQ